MYAVSDSITAVNPTISTVGHYTTVSFVIISDPIRKTTRVCTGRFDIRLLLSTSSIRLILT